jgi:hypothetical protein
LLRDDGVPERLERGRPSHLGRPSRREAHHPLDERRRESASLIDRRRSYSSENGSPSVDGGSVRSPIERSVASRSSPPEPRAARLALRSAPPVGVFGVGRRLRTCCESSEP